MGAALAVASSAHVARAETPELESRGAARSRVVHVPAPRHAVRIEGRYAPGSREFVGTVTVDFENTSRQPLTDLVFHRYLEAFRDDRSVFVRESGGRLRGVRLGGRGSIELRSVKVGGQERIEGIERRLVPDDTTQFRVPLDHPLAPGERLRVEVAFRSHLPDLAARAGTHGRFHMLAQFFPKLAKLEDDGSWWSFPYHGNGEFYADFARYEVRLTTPVGYEVAGTGALIASERRGSEVTRTFVASPVHDAAYAVAADFRISERRCEGVDVRLMWPPGYEVAARSHADATCFGLRYFGERLFPYPYPNLTVVVPPRGAEGGAGMEYPTAFVTDGPWFAHRAIDVPWLFETTLHELGHQWFQGMVATDEVAHPVLDEGLTAFVGTDADAAFRGEPNRLAFELLRQAGASPDVPRADKPASAYSEYDYGMAIYLHSALTLETFARSFGREATYRALRRYARAGAFRHPGPDALVEAFTNEFGQQAGDDLAAVLFRGHAVESHVVGDRLVRTGAGSFRTMTAVQPSPSAPVVRRSHRTPFEMDVDPRAHCAVASEGTRNLLDPSYADDERCPSLVSRRGESLGALVALLFRWVGP